MDLVRTLVKKLKVKIFIVQIIRELIDNIIFCYPIKIFSLKNYAPSTYIRNTCGRVHLESLKI